MPTTAYKSHADYKNKFTGTTFIIMGDFQAPSPEDVNQTIGTEAVQPPHHLLIHYLTTIQPPYVSIVPILHPNTPYITR